MFPGCSAAPLTSRVTGVDGDGRWRTERVQERDRNAFHAESNALDALGPSLRSHRKQSSMPPRWHRRPKHRSTPSGRSDEQQDKETREYAENEPSYQPGKSESVDTEAGVLAQAASSRSAAERLGVFAGFAWTSNYPLIYELERQPDVERLARLREEHTSRHMLRRIRAGGSDGERLAAAVDARLQDTVGALNRAANVLYIPFSQAIKSVAYLAANVSKPIWEAERKQRRVAGREFAKDLLTAMVDCRPPPPYEVCPDLLILASIGFDQTYAKGGGTTGISKYNAVQTVDAQGNRVERERIVYINGQHYPTPLGCVASLSMRAAALISRVGPYTQDFGRIIPRLQPRRLDAFMDSLLERTVGLLQGRAPMSTLEGVRCLLSRPSTDPGGPTYVIFLPPLIDTDTKSYRDMIRIVEWAENYLGGTPLVLHLIGDGQSVLRLRDLKRKYPTQYKHVVVGNGHFHSGSHSQFADCFLWWEAVVCSCMVVIGKVEVLADGTFRGTVRPDIKNLESNSAEHTQQGILPMAVAIVLYFLTRVRSPSPALFLADPVLYVARIQAAGGIVLAQFLRHSGLPTVFWQRGTRAMDSEGDPVMDNLHCLALHKFRCAHKTSSAQISLLHLISTFAAHPELQSYLRARLFVSMSGREGDAVGTDRSVEFQNEAQKERNTGPHVMDALHFTPLLQPMQHVYRQYKSAQGVGSDGSAAFRASIVHEVDALLRFFESKLGTDLETYTESNPFWHTGNPVNMRNGPLRTHRPWEWIWRVASGASAGHRTDTHECWTDWVERHIRHHMFYM